MDNIERDLQKLELAKPPEWLRSRAMIGAENSIMKQAHKRRRINMCIGGAALCATVAVAGYYVIVALGLADLGFSFAPRQPATVEAGSMSSPLPVRIISGGEASFLSSAIKVLDENVSEDDKEEDEEDAKEETDDASESSDGS